MTHHWVPFHRPEITEDEIQSVVATLRSGWLTTGPKVKRFEEQFSGYLGCRHAVAVNSGTAALHLALDAVGIKEGDEVIVPTMTFAATAEVVFYLKAKPVLVDCRPASYRDKKVGAIGDITCFSFYATKTITTGEGGMATTENSEWAERMRMMSLHGISHDALKRYTKAGSWYYEILNPGFKYNLTDIAAAIGIEQLKKCDEFRKAREKIAKIYDRGFADL